jgi:hypothetical protein
MVVRMRIAVKPRTGAGSVRLRRGTRVGAALAC